MQEREWEECEKWLNSLEGILYDLCVFGDVAKEDEKCKLLIAKTLQKLPKEVREKVLDEVIFIIANSCYGTIWNMNLGNEKSMKKTFILLNFTAMRKKSEISKMSIIAHEIAHFILGHGNPLTPSSEKEADDLIKKWGFKKAYNQYF
jgi:hypothetical protein